LAIWYDDPLIVIIVLLVVIIAVGTVIFVMRRYGKNPSPTKKPPQKQAKDIDSEYSNIPFKISKSIQTTMASSAKDELRILDLERDILGDAIRRLYEAHAEGKITEQEREKLAITYKNRMNIIKESISKDEGIVALHELEGMQEDLMKLFSERFGELTSKVEELRTRIDVKPIREIPIKMPSQTPTQIESDEDEEEEEETESPTSGEEKPKKKRKPVEQKPDAKTEAERRIESIRSEVEKVLDKLGQMEIES
jgi:flagellar basal body-associated protein FliL